MTILCSATVVRRLEGGGGAVGRGRRLRSASAIAVLALGSVVGCKGSTNAPAVASVEVTPTSAARQVGETVQLSAAVKDANGDVIGGQTVTWSSNNTSVATVSASGLVTAVTIGVASVSAAAGGHSGSAVITVQGTPVASVTVSPATDTVFVAQTIQLTATVRDATNTVLTDRTVTWSSAASTIATVSQTGQVSGVADGVVTITATSEGKSGTSQVTVIGPCSLSLAPDIDVGDVVQAELSQSDCALDDNTYADGYRIMVPDDTEVQIDLTAQYDTWLWLLEFTAQNELNVVAINDDIDDTTTNSRIIYTLAAGGEYYILANSFDPFTFGQYELSVMTTTPFTARLKSGVLKPGKAPLTRSLRPIRKP